MYLQTSRLQYNLQKVGVFQTAHSDKNIQAKACKMIIVQKFLFCKQCTSYNIELGRKNHTFFDIIIKILLRKVLLVTLRNVVK